MTPPKHLVIARTPNYKQAPGAPTPTGNDPGKGNPSGNETPPAAQSPAAGNPPGEESPENKGDTEQGAETITITVDELQKRIDSVVKDRLDRERRKSDRDAQKIKEDAERESLEKSQEWQKLAEKQKETITTLESQLADHEALKTKFEAYEKALKSYLETQRAGLPKHIVGLLDKLDPVEQLEYIAANRDDLAKKPAAPIPNTPKPAEGEGMTPEQKEDAKNKNALFYKSVF